MTCICSMPWLFIFLLCLHAAACPTKLDNFVKDLAPGRQVDLVFVIDQSISINEEQFCTEGRSVVGAVLKQYSAIHPDYTRVAVVTSARDSRVVFDYISSNETTITKCDLFDGNSPTPWDRVTYMSDVQSTSGNILAAPSQQAVHIFMVGKQNRLNTNQILLLLTDGNYNDSEDVIHQVELLKDDGVTVYTCGFGSWLNPCQVRSLASKDAFYRSYEDWCDMLTTNLTSYTSGERLLIHRISCSS